MYGILKKDEDNRGGLTMSQSFRSFIGSDTYFNLSQQPERVAVLGFPDYDSLKALGLEGKIVAAPKGNIPAYIGQMPNSIIDTEDLHQPNLEAIRASQPDLIIASGRARASIDALEKIAPVFMYETTREDYWKTFREVNLELAKIFGKEKKVQDLIQQIDDQAQDIQDYNASHSGQTTLTLMLSQGEYKDFSKHSRFAFIYQYLNFDALGQLETKSSHGDHISAQAINDLDPERIFVIDRNKAIQSDDNQSLLQDDLLKETQAYKNGRVYELDAALWYLGGGGLASTLLQIEEISKSL